MRTLKPALGLAFALAIVIVGVGIYLRGERADSSEAAAAPTRQQPTADVGREVDFGFAELNPATPTSIASYKNGGNVVLYAGEELRYEVLGDHPLPPIELRVGDTVQTLSAADGKLPIAGPPGQAQPALLAAQGARYSLPGGSPPRVSVKVQVYGGTGPR